MVTERCFLVNLEAEELLQDAEVLRYWRGGRPTAGDNLFLENMNTKFKYKTKNLEYEYRYKIPIQIENTNTRGA